MAWYDGAIFYHILPGAVSPDGEKKSAFLCMEEQLPYLKVLGIDAVILGPLFSEDPLCYGARDFTEINPRLGTEEAFCHYVERAHSMGVKVMLDVAVLFSSRSFFAFQDLLQHKEKSAYRSWYKDVQFTVEGEREDGFTYAAWKDLADYPLFNFDDEDLRMYIVERIKDWISRFDIDGLRLAHCTCMDIHFQKSLRYFTGQMKAEFFLLGDVKKGDPLRYINAETLQSICNYDFYQNLVRAFNEKNFYPLAEGLRKNEEYLLKCNTFLENPRTDRIATVIEDKKNLYGVYAALFSLPGRVSLYYGAEYGLTGKKEEDEEALLSSGLTKEEYTPNRFTSFVAKLSEIHGKNSELQNGQYKEVYLDHRLYAFLRIDENSGVLSVLNNDAMDQFIRLSIPFRARLAFDLFTQDEVEIGYDGKLRVFCPAHSGRLIKVK